MQGDVEARYAKSLEFAGSRGELLRTHDFF